MSNYFTLCIYKLLFPVWIHTVTITKDHKEMTSTSVSFVICNPVQSFK